MDMMASIAAMSPQQGSAGGPQATSAHPAKSHPSQNGAQGINHPQPSTSTTQQQNHMRHPLPQVPNSNNNKGKGGPKSHGAGQPNHAHRANQAGQHHHHQSSSTPIVPAQDFDFASANAKFNKAAPTNQTKAEDGSNVGQKETVDGGAGAGTTAEGGKTKGDNDDDFVIPEAPPGTYYDKKKSFFDDISSEVKERLAISSQDGPSKSSGGINGTGPGRGGKGWDRNAERQRNLDTFGEVALNPNLGALGSGYNGYGRGGAHRMAQMGGGVNGYRGMPGRGRGPQGRGSHHHSGGGRGGFPPRAAHPAPNNPSHV